MAEASGGRTHRRHRKMPPAGFEDRDDHRTACASARDQISKVEIVAVVASSPRCKRFAPAATSEPMDKTALLRFGGWFVYKGILGSSRRRFWKLLSAVRAIRPSGLDGLVTFRAR